MSSKLDRIGISLDMADKQRIELIRQKAGLRTKMDAIRQALRNEVKRLSEQKEG